MQVYLVLVSTQEFFCPPSLDDEDSSKEMSPEVGQSIKDLADNLIQGNIEMKSWDGKVKTFPEAILRGRSVDDLILSAISWNIYSDAIPDA